MPTGFGERGGKGRRTVDNGLPSNADLAPLPPVDHGDGRCSQCKDEGERDNHSNHVVHNHRKRVISLGGNWSLGVSATPGPRADGVDLGEKNLSKRPSSTDLPGRGPSLPGRG